MRYRPFKIRMYGQAQAGERGNPRRGIAREQAAAIFPVASRGLRTWAARYGQRSSTASWGAHGGQGRKPAVPGEEIDAAIKKGTESGGLQSAPQGRGGQLRACRG